MRHFSDALCTRENVAQNRDDFLSAEESVIGGLAGRYAVALFELAQELDDAAQAKIADNMAGLKVLIDGSDDLQKLLKSPVINAEEQAAAAAAAAKQAATGEAGVAPDGRRGPLP